MHVYSLHIYISSLIRLAKPIAGASSITDIVLAPARSTTAHSLTQFNALPSFFFVVCRFFKINFIEKFFQIYHQSVKQFGSKSGTTNVGHACGPIFIAKTLSRQKFAYVGVVTLYEFQEYHQSVKQFGSKSGTSCLA